MYDRIKEYEDYMNKIGNRQDLYEKVARKFKVARALYPGCHIDISPSLVISDVVYIDNYKGAIKFFKNFDEIKTFIDLNKVYKGPCKLKFYL